MDNSTATLLEEDWLLVTQLELVSPTTVAGTLYGIALTLFCLYVHSLAPRLRDADRQRQSRFMLGYSTLIMLCGLCLLISNAWVTQDAYIKHSDYPDGPESYILSSYHATPAIPMIFASEIIVDVLTSAIQIWRVWVIWSATRYAILITVLPVLCLLTFTGLRLRSVILETTLPSLIEATLLDLKTQVVEFATQAAITILCTLLISLYLIYMQWQQRKLIGKSQGSIGYMNIVAMIIESYVLESVWLLVMAILWNPNPPVMNFFVESAPYIEIIAYLLVQYRVANGKAYESQRDNESQRDKSKISSLHWRHSSHVTTHYGGTGGDYGGPDVSTALPEVPDVSRPSSMA